MDKPIYWGFFVLELSKLLIYETFYDILQPFFGQQNIQLHYMDTDSFLLSVNTQNLIDYILKGNFDFSIINKENELFNNANKIEIGKFKNETPENIWIDEIVCLRSKAYACTGKRKIYKQFKRHF